MTEKSSVPERVQAAYRNLSVSATNLNAASDELRIVILVLEDVLRKLNLGISTWVKIAGNDDVNGDFWSRDLGYARVGGKWGIALRDISGNCNYEEMDKVEEWPFNDAPRWLRIDGVGKIPELLEKLTKQADDTAEKIRKKTAEADAIARAITGAAAERVSMPDPPTLPPPPLPTSAAKAAAKAANPIPPPPSPFDVAKAAALANKWRK